MTDMKVLIVDDEEYAREGLVNSIPWTEYGFSELMQARNGEEALQICQWFHPDLVLTDIQMPKLTGVEFAHKLAEICPESKLIFITAYMEIRYLREAITLSAVDFLEKPISVAAVNKAVKKAVASLQKQRGQRSSDRKRKELESEKLAQTLRYRDQDREALLNMCQEIDFPQDGWYFSVVLSHRENGDLADLTEAFDHFLGSVRCRRIGTEIEDNRYLMIVACGKNERAKLAYRVRQFAEQHQEGCFGIGFEVSSLFALSESIQIARYNEDRGFFSEQNFYELNETLKNGKKFSHELYTELNEIVKQKPQELKNWIRRMFDQFRATPGYWKKDVQNFVLQILQILTSEEKTLAAKIPQAAEEDLDQYVQQVPSLSLLQDFMETICDLYLQEIQDNQAYSRLVQDVLHYIEGHCSNPALNVSVIADYFHFSNTHMNALFKQETGVTLKKYIINYRLELSKSMLRNKHYKINEIAARCGYANGNYFSKVFKAETGMVPNDYRKKYL